MTARRRSVATVVWWGVAAVIAVSVVFAPIRTVGWCANAGVEGGPVCSDLQESLLGIESTLWLWLISVGAVVVLTVMAALARARSDPEAESSGSSPVTR